MTTRIRARCLTSLGSKPCDRIYAIQTLVQEHNSQYWHQVTTVQGRRMALKMLRTAERINNKYL